MSKAYGDFWSGWDAEECTRCQLPLEYWSVRIKLRFVRGQGVERVRR